MIALALPLLAATLAAAPAAAADGAPAVQEIVRDNVRLRLELRHEAAADGDALRAGDTVQLALSIADARSGEPLSGLRPSLWLDTRKPGVPTECGARVGSFLNGMLAYRPDIDLNGWTLAVLNDKPSITVIDPLQGFGGQRTLALVLLPAAGSDWVADDEQKRLVVAMPGADALGAVDTGRWRLVQTASTGRSPERLMLQPDGRLLWVSHGGADTDLLAAVIPATLAVAGQVRVGAGPHALAFGDGMVVAASSDGTASFVDARDFAVRKRLDLPGRPIGAAFSALSRSFWLATAEGAVIEVDSASLEVRRRIDLAPGLRAVATAPDGRWLLVANHRAGRLTVIDTATGGVAQEGSVERRPYQIAFSNGFAYIRAEGSEKLSAIPLARLGQGEGLAVSSVIAGRAAPELAGAAGDAAAMAAVPGGGGIIVASPVDRALYLHMDGMNAPMGSFRNGPVVPRGVLVVDRALKERQPGRYQARAQLVRDGVYDIALLLANPQLTACFAAEVAADPDAPPPPLPPLPRLACSGCGDGGDIVLDLEMIDQRTLQPFRSRSPIEVILFAKGGNWQRRLVPEVTAEGGAYVVPIGTLAPGSYGVAVRMAEFGHRAADVPDASFEVAPRRR